MARKRVTGRPSGYTILVVDDQEDTLVSVKLVLEHEGHRVLLAESGRRALEIFGREEVHLILVDYFMPRMTGEELIREIRRVNATVQILLQTGYSGEKPPRDMLHHLDIQGYHDKSEGPDKLLLWVDVALKANEQLRLVREAEVFKSQLLANVSHEFRTPLHIILGYTDMLREDHARESSGRQTLDRVHENAEMLLRLVDDFLALAHLDSGVTASECVDVDAQTLRMECMRCVSILGGEKPIGFEWQVAEHLPLIAADAVKLRVILMNLLSNAFKFTEAGSITVTAEWTDQTVSLAIRDPGIGIAEQDHEIIFDAFRQVDGSDTRTHQRGTGIGLPIARKLARLMCGDITVASTLGHGATFSLHLRRADAAASPTGLTAAPVAADA